jgi:hypothetical protein
VDDSLSVSVTNNFRDLSKDIESLINSQSATFIAEKTIERDRIRVASEEKNRTVFTLRRRIRFDDTLVIETFEKLKLANGGLSDDFPLLCCRLPRHHINTGKSRC